MDNKKAAAAAAVAAVISASGAAVEANFDSPADILQNSDGEPKVEYVNSDNTAADSDTVTADDEKQRQDVQGGSAVRQVILKLPLAVRALFVVPQWIIGSLVVHLGGLLFAGLSPVLHWVLSFVLFALVIAAAFTVTAKAMFPDLPLRKILNRHSIKWILIASAAAFAADLVLGAFWAGYAHFKALVTFGLILLSLVALLIWFTRRENRRRQRLEESRAQEEAPEPEELVYTSLGQTFTVRPERKE